MEKQIKNYLTKLRNLFPNEYFSISSEYRIYSNGEMASELTLIRVKNNQTSFVIFFKNFDEMENTIKFILAEPILPKQENAINNDIDPNE